MTLSLRYLLLFIWMLVIFLFSNQVSHTSSAQSAVFVNALEALHVSLPEDVLTFLTRKAAHTFIYFVLGILMFNVVRSYNIPTRRAILLSIVFVCGYACTDEFHQIFVSGRSPEVTDVLIDTCGGALGVATYYAASKIRVRFSRGVAQSIEE